MWTGARIWKWILGPLYVSRIPSFQRSEQWIRTVGWTLHGSIVILMLIPYLR
jgi:hypothetical protein